MEKAEIASSAQDFFSRESFVRTSVHQAVYGVFYDANVSVDRKVERNFDNLVDVHFSIKDLLFGNFDSVKGRVLQGSRPEMQYRLSEKHRLPDRFHQNIDYGTGQGRTKNSVSL